MPALAIVVACGIVVGTIDLAFAMTFWNITQDTPPIRILHSIAAGLLGREDAIAGGNATAVLGAGCHYTIAIGMALAYYLVARRWNALVEHPFALGAAYGALLYLIMSFVVLPLSAVGMPKFNNTAWVVASIAAHVVFGVIFAHGSRRALA